MDLIDNNIDNVISTDSAKICDDSLKENADFAERAGLEVHVVRKYDGVGLSGKRQCEWCLNRCGEYDSYEEAYDKGAFERHPGCGCVIEYVSKKVVNKSRSASIHTDVQVEKIKDRIERIVGSKKLTPQERAINAAIQAQRNASKADVLVDAIVENHEALKYYTPAGMKKILEDAGYIIKTLSRGSQKGKPFEEGGGYKINFGGDGIFQYHPAEGSHHGGSYWKIQHGKVGVWYDGQGKEIKRNQN